MQSLKDQLLRAGLVSKEQAEQAQEEKKRVAAQPVSRPAPRPASADRAPRAFERAPAAAPVSVPKFAPLPGSKQAQREESRRQIELDKALREVVLRGQVPEEIGASVFYFVTRKNKLRRMLLTEAQAKKIEAGELAVVERPDPDRIEHALVPPAIADELLALSAKTVRFFNRPGQAVGFLSEEEIHQRAFEADAPETETDAPAAAAATEPTGANEEQGGGWVTVKRAPLAGAKS